ncbi:hypothetical protein [Blastomonas aquatica]|uniref:Uncharacterized protein n=1 Tax=Blastomonas aquatica TaxID=1510276 RepID=A0ABQ1IXM7_9SPHN|nr:hypothetical protein [Blastomonas aquatica]GGB52687.1 hypothetical protein GCM10010833_04230 [Blastomonas aquatica]
MFRLFHEERYISRIYYESMRDNFEGYAWKSDEIAETDDPESNAMKRNMLAQLKEEFQELDPLNGSKPTLGQLFKIELALVWLVPKTALQARFWTIEDRFRRVVPTSVIASYEASYSAGAIEELEDEVLRQRARNLLDVIHANYLINLARENSIRRLMAIVGLSAAVVILLGVAFISSRVELAQHGLVAIIAAGMVGAMISILQRLQKATSRDAMVEDGIFELIGLRVGWVSVLSSIGIGGVFALFIYVLAAANLLDALLPDFGVPDGSGDPANPGSELAQSDVAAGNAAGTDAAGAADLALTDPVTGQVAVAAATDPVAPVGSAASAAPAPATQPQQVSAATADACGNPTNTCPNWVERVRMSLGLADTAQFYKMIVLAFVSGFAERFVPDIINKLAKQNPAATATSGPTGSGNPTM